MAYKFNFKSNNTQKRKKISPIFILIGLVIIYAITVLFLPFPKIEAQKADFTIPNSFTAKISWFGGKQSAIGALDYGIIATSGEQTPAPIASIAKTVLALAVLKEKPLQVGEQGPEIVISATDVELYKSHLAQNGSVLPVTLNDKLTEYQMLQGLMIPSGNNIADTLATWAFGSVSNYLNYANQMVKDWGLNNTTISDASGFSAQTMSSASDLVIIGEYAMKDKVLREIVSQDQVTLPTAGTVKNYNTLLGINNIIGIKTGNSDEAGGCFLFATKNNLDGKEVIIIGAILGDETRNKALQNTKALIEANVRNFQIVTLVKEGQEIGWYDLPWGKKIPIKASSDVSIFVANGEKASLDININELTSSKKSGDQVGEIVAKAGTVTVKIPATINEKISKPPLSWRLIHP